MTDRPIIFSAPMVRALLDGRKTMTRRLAWKWEKRGGDHGHGNLRGPASPWQAAKPGDRLWVREAWWTHCTFDATAPADLRSAAEAIGHDVPIWFADDDTARPWGKARPSIHMPRWASRITLTVTAVRVERLQDISEADAMAEGWPGPTTDIGCPIAAPRAWFNSLWDTLHPRPYGWADNPEVVALTFDVVRRNIDA